MPGPHSRDAPRFKGKWILQFLVEYELCATVAGLSSTQTIQQITCYCDTRSERFIKSLDEYYKDNWDLFKSRLLEFYPLEEERPYYRPNHLLKFIQKEQRFSSVKAFDEYFHRFMVIVKSLEDRKALSETDKHNYFWRGIKPPSFCEEIAIVLQNSKRWTDLTSPPLMNKVTRMVKLRLRQDLYQVLDDDDDEELDAHKDVISSDSSKEEKASSTLDSDMEEELRHPRVKRHHIKHETKQKKEVSLTKPLEAKPEDTPEPVKSSMDDLAEKIGCLSIAISQYEAERIGKQLVKTTSAIQCFMCGEYGHLLKECLKMKAFITKNVLKMSNNGWLVQADGSSLPHGDLDDCGIAQVLHNQMSHASNVETEYLHSFDLFNQEVTVPEEQREACTKKWVEPCDTKELKGHLMKCPIHTYAKLSQQSCQMRLLKSKVRIWIVPKSTG
ncbi:hypothetical protein BS47DRAFT_1367234 [Hydnum rufescens UP504]|uniref:CCHC-type domain-containing protein n=1 Tax=Hydnum rufescens UP504 TaxID=1448309 RepID=A0A9P6AIZ3_9AGAM|nr:hypothetical protein BS47DRAFT_1367234 [Hydnum rufescens UP504]